MKGIIMSVCINFAAFSVLLALALVSPCAGQASNPVPTPASEQALPTQIAEEWLVESPANNILEGAIMDREGNLLFCDISKKSVLRLDHDKKISTVVELPELAAGGLALHEDGRIFMAALDLDAGKGAILAWSPDAKKLETIIAPEAGYWPNDLVLAPDGGFYFSDFRGNSTSPQGGVYYVSPDYRQIIPVFANLAQANGVALSPDGKTLWATEFAKNRLHRADLKGVASIPPVGSSIPYYFTGPAPDSMRVDSQGNVYVAIYGQGRVLIFNRLGIPIGQILLPDREKGLNLLCTSLAIQPGGNDLFIVSSNSEKDKPARIFRAKSLAPGLPPAAGSKKGS